MKKQNYWLKQEKQEKSTKQSKLPKTKTNELSTLPIIQVLEKSKNEEAHFKVAFDYARHVSSPTSSQIVHIYLTMQDTLLLNPKWSDELEGLLKKGHLLEIVSFPRNWESLSLDNLVTLLKLDLDEDDDADEYDTMTSQERFDFIYEYGLRLI